MLGRATGRAQLVGDLANNKRLTVFGSLGAMDGPLATRSEGKNGLIDLWVAMQR